MTPIVKCSDTKTFALMLIAFLVAVSLFTFLPKARAVDTYLQEFGFSGPFDEYTNDLVTAMSGDVNVTAHYASSSIPSASFSFNNYLNWGTNDTILYFTFDYNGSHREYWLTSDDQFAGSRVVNVFFSSVANTTEYVINFLDYVGTLKTYNYILAQVNDGGTYHTVDKRPIDAQNSVTFGLIEGSRYRLVYTNGVVNNTYGDIVTTATTGIQLILRGIDFSAQTILLYQYVHTESVRDFLNPIGAITTSYEDTTNQTTSVNITITNATSGLVAFQMIVPVNSSFSFTWANAVNATNYQVTVTITHATYGTFYYKQYLPGEYTKPSEPFSLDFLGTSLPVSTAVLIPALIIIFVAGCFSELNSEVASILTCIVAIILTALGWIPITQSAIIVALTLSLLAGIVTVRRRFT